MYCFIRFTYFYVLGIRSQMILSDFEFRGAPQFLNLLFLPELRGLEIVSFEELRVSLERKKRRIEYRDFVI